MTTAPNILSGPKPSGDRIVVDGRMAIVAGVVALVVLVGVFWLSLIHI